MNEIGKYYDDSDRDSIKFALQRLFVLQDKPSGEQKLNVFLDEILKYDFPIKAILEGIKGLQGENMQQIKLGSIIEAIKSKIQFEEPEKTSCNYCFGVGTVSLSDEAGRRYAFACICANGNKFASDTRLARWNGKLTQYARNGAEYKVADRVIQDELLGKYSTRGN